jgi:nitroreductase
MPAAPLRFASVAVFSYFAVKQNYQPMFKKIANRLNDVTRIHHRAAFSGVQKRTPGTVPAFQKLAHERYSCRDFTDAPVSDEDINLILEAGRQAPTAVNNQPVHVWVVKDAAIRERLKEATQYTFDAPVIFVVAGKEADAWVRKYDGKNAADVDAAIVGTHIMLQVADLGLGTTWVGSFDPAKLGEIIPEIPANGYTPVVLFPVGHIYGGPSPRHGQRKSMEEFTTVL